MLLQDIRYALRTLRKTPVFAAAAILTIALGIGGTTAIFSVVNAVILRPLPFAEPGRLFQVAEKNDKLHLPYFAASVLNYLSWKEQAKSLDMAAAGFGTFNLTGRGDPEQFTGGRLSPSLMPLLGIHPAVGRGFQEAEERPNAERVAMISEGLWKRRFAADRAVLGTPVTLNGLSYTIVGIAPPSLPVLIGGDVWIPLTIDPGKEIRLNHVIVVVGRLHPGVTMAQAQAELDGVSSRVGQANPEVRDWGIRLQSFDDWLIAATLRTALVVLLGAVGLVLLIACTNVANLLLSRAAARHTENAVRTALGASRGRLIRQLLTESIVLSAIGGALGIAAALWTVKVMNTSLPPNLLPVPDVTVDATVLWFAAGVTLLTGFLFGTVPALQAARIDVHTALKQAGRSVGAGRPLLRNGLVAGELALATVLLIGAGLLLQTVLRLQHVDVGFRTENLLTFQIALPNSKYPGPVKTWGFQKQMMDSLETIPGVRAAAVSTGIPFGAGAYNTSPGGADGKSTLPDGATIPIIWRAVSPSYFRTLEIPLLRGRYFTDADGPGPTSVTIISQETATKIWGTDDPIGRTLVLSGNRRFEIVGVSGGVRFTTLGQAPEPTMYLPVAWRQSGFTDVVVRTAGKPEAVLSAVRRRIHDLDAELPMSNVRTMEQWLSNSAAQPRLNAVLVVAFAGIALIIAAIGIYGVLSYSVEQRTREIGLRMAIGAQRPDVVRLVVREGLLVAIGGIGAGLLAAFALSRTLASILYGVQPRDPATFAFVPVVLAIVALLACYLPARRASRIDPMVALRYD